MASQILIRVGALEAKRDYANDAEVAAILGRYYRSIEGAPANATNQQRLDFIVAHLVATIQERAAAVHRHELRAAREAEDTEAAATGNTLR